MRKALIALVATSFAAAVGCEDGPNQTYTPAPSGAGQRWNDGRTGGISDDGGTQGFVTDQNGRNPVGAVQRTGSSRRTRA